MAWENSFVVFDLETGGLITKAGIPPITEIAIVVLRNDLSEAEVYSSLIKPYVDLSKYTPAALEVSGITIPQLVAEGKDPLVVLKEVIAVLKRATTKKKPILIGHNIDAFDISILAEYFEVHKEDFSKYVESNMSIDTMWWARICNPGYINHKLGTCLQERGIDLTQAHRALNDTKGTAELAKIFLSNLRGNSTQKLENISSFRKSFKFQL